MKTITKIYPMVTPWGTGVFIPVSHELDIKKDAEYAVDSFCRVFEKNGVGWITENLGAAKNLKNCTKIRCYYGSSIYDGVQMSNLIACAVNEAENLGIETRTPEEVASLLKAWGEHETK